MRESARRWPEKPVSTLSFEGKDSPRIPAPKTSSEDDAKLAARWFASLESCGEKDSNKKTDAEWEGAL
jgi:hypothetical protein